MSDKKKEYATETSMENVENALSKTEQFIEDNQKILTIIMFAIIIVIGGYWGAKKLYFAPQELKAQEVMFGAQNFFEKDSFQLALDGQDLNLGFIDIIDDYGFTAAGNLSKYYAGVCYLQLGQFDEAIEYLAGFTCEDELLNANAKGALGDAYMEKGDVDAAISSYKSAADVDNDIIAATYLFKLGLAFEGQKDYDKAIEAYQQLKDEHKSANEARTIDKYITRATILASK